MSSPASKLNLPREFPGVHYYGVEEEAAALRVIRERSPFRYYGANFLAEADSLEKEFGGRLGRRYAQAVSSCTNGLVSAIAAFGIGPGQEVLQTGKRNIDIVSLEPVGSYAVQPTFSDGHATGIFAWDYLYSLGEDQGRLWAEYEKKLAEAGAVRDPEQGLTSVIPGPSKGHCS